MKTHHRPNYNHIRILSSSKEKEKLSDKQKICHDKKKSMSWWNIEPNTTQRKNSGSSYIYIIFFLSLHFQKTISSNEAVQWYSLTRETLIFPFP